MQEGRAAIQSGVHSLDKQAAERNLMKFIKKQMQSLALHQYRLGVVTRMQLHMRRHRGP